MPQPLPDGLVSFRDVGFERLDSVVLLAMAGRLATAAALGAIIAFRPWRHLLRGSFERTESGAQTLMAVAGALVTAVVGNHFALALGLVGAGSFIRFRAGIKDAREAAVMFLAIGVGMASGAGMMAVALTAVATSVALLAVLDAVDQQPRRAVARRRLRFSNVEDPRRFEPELRAVLGKVAKIRGSKISTKNDEVVLDVHGDAITAAGEAVSLLEAEGVHVTGDVSCEEIG